jgi:seryl-tRNA synthetase
MLGYDFGLGYNVCMLDWKKIVQNPDSFRQGLKARGMEAESIEKELAQVLGVSKLRLEVQKKVDDLRAERNKVSQEVAALMRSGRKSEAEPLVQRGKDIGAELEALELRLSSSESEFAKVLEALPNLPHESVPVGRSAADNAVVREWGTKKGFDFSPRSHDEIGALGGGIDFERAAKVTGSRFVFLRGAFAQLERALVNFMIDHHRARGYEEFVPPYIVNSATLFGTGQFPKFREDVFALEGADRYLIPTAEVPLTNFFRDEILDVDALPIKLCAFSPCFRSEAGSYGKDTKGLIRQHQFHKVELVKFSSAEQSQSELESMVQDAESVLQALEIPYRTVLLCSGDMGFSSMKTYDIEVWLPGSVTEGQAPGTRGCYREISSCSDCGDFQARRAGIRVRNKAEKGTRLVHTLNGSGLAVGRTLIAVLENYQKADGSVEVPRVLKPYLKGVDEIRVEKRF